MGVGWDTGGSAGSGEEEGAYTEWQAAGKQQPRRACQRGLKLLKRGLGCWVHLAGAGVWPLMP